MSSKTLQANLELVNDTSSDRLPANTHNKGNTNSRSDNRTSSDFNYPDKKMGFINLEASAFSFIGPDRESIKTDHYIDDYIVVTSKSKASEQFAMLCDLLDELGLPMNKDKLTPPSKRITCRGIDIDID